MKKKNNFQIIMNQEYIFKINIYLDDYIIKWIYQILLSRNQAK